ncbi:olfactory receptor 13-like [Xenopus tropicalis]|uniref:Olfactory receptor n=1 Tax=Xenopus tropicalis TaxID=8364 RepID=A0A8J1J8A0_XENTR|nr:olfactory receptor 13-like [Xenopus tropicalis]
MPENELTNKTLQREFHLLAFLSHEKLQLLIFLLVLLMYSLTVCANLIITALVCLVPRLHTPMYFFLCNLSVQDIVYVTAILPKFLAITITGDNSISFLGCMTQMYLYALCVMVEFLLLTSMAYDRYVAICIPMRYSLIMKKSVCVLLASDSWLIGAIISFTYCWLVVNLQFCDHQEIDHFFCDLKTVLELSCGDTTNLKSVILAVCVLIGFLPFGLILISYGNIISSALKIRTSAGKLKTFSSCCSHLTVVLLFCGTSLSLYMKPDSGNSQEMDKLLSLLYVAVTPLLNPLVYSLRNKDIINAIKNIIKLYFWRKHPAVR